MLEQAVIFGKRRRVARAELAEAAVEQPAAQRRPAADNVDIVGTEEHRRQPARQLRCCFQLHVVGVKSAAAHAAEVRLKRLLPAAGVDDGGDDGVVAVEGDEVFIPLRGAEGVAGGEIVDGLKQVRLPLRVVPDDDVDTFGKLGLKVFVVAKTV
jgi:hypothetical protein